MLGDMPTVEPNSSAQMVNGAKLAGSSRHLLAQLLKHYRTNG